MEIRLQSILLPESGICDVAELYYHENGKAVAFDGYFNLFYIEKRKTYTAIDDVYISLQLQGYREIVLYHDRKRVGTQDLEPPVCREYRIELPYAAYDSGVFWFELVKDVACEERSVSGSYEGRIDEQWVRPVNIGIDICTYHREAYIERNLNTLKRRFYDTCELDAGRHRRVYVVDNGQTLGTCEGVHRLVEACGGRVRIIPNRNSGGAGGFTRGMLEILDEKEAQGLTHVLLMDDDAVIEPDAVVRIYGLVSTLKDEWRGMTVGGAMMREEYPHILFCAGENWENGQIINTSWNLDVRDFANACCSRLTETGHEHDRYSGWWCCCYSLDTVRADNLPLPLFIHHDDIEFGLRNRGQGIVFLNGVGVWHRGAELLFPGANWYYDVRNNLVETALHQDRAPKQTARRIVLKAFVSSLMRLKYKDADLVYRGVTDFLKGPAWLYRQNPEGLNTEIRALSYPMHPVEDLEDRLTEAEYESVCRQIRDYRESLSMETIQAGKRTKKWKKLLSWCTLNGWFLPGIRQEIRVICSTDSPYATFGRNKIVLYEPGSGRAYLLERDYRMLAKVVWLSVKGFVALERGFDAAAASYRMNISKITNRKAWKEYLKNE
ncbi:MAG: glycosyltransferase [Clostridiales bacterium]|nr:glycosyltransferase [Clostridiales bacterium]